MIYPAAGAALGAIYFTLLRRAVCLHASQVAVLRIAPLHFLRIGMAVLVFWVTAQQGALPLLLALLGFLAVRFAALRWLWPE